MPATIVRPSTVASTPWPATASNAVTGRKPSSSRLARVDDRGSQRVLAAALGGCREVEQLGDVRAGGGHDLHDLGPAHRQGAGLVEDDGVDAMRDLERLAALDEDAGLRSAAGADHDGRRRRKAHRARAGDDHGGDRARQCPREARLRPERAARPRT